MDPKRPTYCGLILDFWYTLLVLTPMEIIGNLLKPDEDWEVVEDPEQPGYFMQRKK